MTDERWLAIGLDLRLLTTGEGGRRTPVRLDIPFQYRPNWGLVGMPDREQVGAPVFCASSVEVTPGSSARAVIIPLFEGSLPQWRSVRVGDELRMYEGSRICGLGAVQWVEPARLPLPPDDDARFRVWTQQG